MSEKRRFSESSVLEKGEEFRAVCGMGQKSATAPSVFKNRLWLQPFSNFRLWAPESEPGAAQIISSVK